MRFVRALNTVFQVGRCSFRRVQSSSSAAMFGVVVHKHVVGDSQDVTLHAHRGRNNHLRNHGTIMSFTLMETPANSMCISVYIVALNRLLF